MPLENATYLEQLDATSPLTGDQTAQGDDHLRLLKAVLKKTFSGLSGEFGRVVVKGANFTPALTDNSVTFVGDRALTCTLPVLSGLPAGYFLNFRAQGGTFTIAPAAGETLEGFTPALVLPMSANAVLVKQSDISWTILIGGRPADPPFAAGTRLVFAQAAAPTGWVQDTSDSANNRMLRVVSSAGGGAGGSHSPILNAVVPAHTHGFLTGYFSADHMHSGSTGGRSAAHTHNVPHYGRASSSGGSSEQWMDAESALTYRTTTAESADHGHSFSTGGVNANHYHSGSTDNGSSQANWVPRYIDLILCTKS